MEDRLQKILSAAGVCSRRRAETYIQQGRVTVNGRPGVLGERADPDRDQIALDGVPVGRRGDHQVLMLYKPRGVVTTLSDEKGRPTVADLVRDCGERVWPVGRLDMDSEGLLLLTGDGALTHGCLNLPGASALSLQIILSSPRQADPAERLRVVFFHIRPFLCIRYTRLFPDIDSKTYFVPF